MKIATLALTFVSALALRAAAETTTKLAVLKTQDESGATSVLIYGVGQPGYEAESAKRNKGDGMPIYGPMRELPEMNPTTWGRYRPSDRPSRQLEHKTGTVYAGYLR